MIYIIYYYVIVLQISDVFINIFNYCQCQLGLSSISETGILNHLQFTFEYRVSLASLKQSQLRWRHRSAYAQSPMTLAAHAESALSLFLSLFRCLCLSLCVHFVAWVAALRRRRRRVSLPLLSLSRCACATGSFSYLSATGCEVSALHCAAVLCAALLCLHQFSPMAKWVRRVSAVAAVSSGPNPGFFIVARASGRN